MLASTLVSSCCPAQVQPMVGLSLLPEATVCVAWPTSPVTGYHVTAGCSRLRDGVPGHRAASVQMLESTWP